MPTGGRPIGGAFLLFRVLRGRPARLGIFVLRRVLWMVPVVFFVILITFVLAHLAPGSPWDRGAGRQLSAAVIHNRNVTYGLDKPYWQQFLVYIWNVAHLNFGLSFQFQDQSVSGLLLAGWPYTLTLGLTAFCLIVPVGILLGVVAALRQNSKVDYIATAFATLGATIPNFVIAILLIIVLGVGARNATGGNLWLPFSGIGLDSRLILPVIAISALPIAYVARLTRASTLEILRQEYVRTAWAKGLPERLVIGRHVLLNALIPVITALGPIFAFLLTGSVIIETVFSIPGIGSTFVTAVNARDYPMILATTILFSFVIAAVNLVVDILYVVIDPRVRLS